MNKTKTPGNSNASVWGIIHVHVSETEQAVSPINLPFIKPVEIYLNELYQEEHLLFCLR